MVIKLSGVQFSLKSKARFQNYDTKFNCRFIAATMKSHLLI